MNGRFSCWILLGVSAALISTGGCATRKFARNQINARVTPLEQRTGELEETSRRNSQDIGSLNSGVQEVRGKVDRAQNQADSAMAEANEANSKVDQAEHSVSELRSNLDKYSLEKTAVVNFRFDSYVLTPEAKAALDAVGSEIKDRGNFVLEIEGFADYVGTETYNDKLTEKRADAVREYLAENYNIPIYRMYMLGFGKSRPVADNHTRDGRAENRRVEVRLLTRGTGTASPTEARSSSSSH
ncbi:MAG TPA: OmpA family protein [Blastocatellia bacterium]|nr:OmpA family protein [Blastocatellia bacterium]